MANKTRATRKKPVSQKRVALVLASLVGTLTVSCGVLLLMEGGALGTSPVAFARPPITAQLDPTAPLQRGAWNYIIIYQSGDLAGSSASLADGRLVGGSDPAQNSVRPKANFHFVIDSARSRRGAVDGDLEVSNAWQNQTAGAPYAGWPDYRYHTISPYKNAVGICLIGDLTREPLSEAQHRNLLQLVRELQDRLNIPAERVLFQWELEPNASSATPFQVSYAQGVRASIR